MPYRPPLVPHETFVADPPELPVRAPGEGGLSALVRADLIGTDDAAAWLKGTTDAGEALVVSVGVAGEGVLRVRLSADADARSRSARALPLVTPGGYDGARVTVADRLVRVDAGPIAAEITLDPWHQHRLRPCGGHRGSGHGRHQRREDAMDNSARPADRVTAVTGPRAALWWG